MHVLLKKRASATLEFYFLKLAFSLTLTDNLILQINVYLSAKSPKIKAPKSCPVKTVDWMKDFNHALSQTISHYDIELIK